MSPAPIEDPHRVDERRRAVGLRPLDENTRLMREGVARSNEPRPRDLVLRRRQEEDWARSVGWRD
jgi:hypothetical protein